MQNILQNTRTKILLTKNVQTKQYLEKSLKQNSYPRGLKPLRNEYRSTGTEIEQAGAKKPYNQMNKQMLK